MCLKTRIRKPPNQSQQPDLPQARPVPTAEESARRIREIKLAGIEQRARERYAPGGIAKLLGTKPRYGEGYKGERHRDSPYYQGKDGTSRIRVVKDRNGKEQVAIDGQAIGEGIAAGVDGLSGADGGGDGGGGGGDGGGS